MQHPVLHEEDVGAGGLGDLPAPVEHERVGIARPLGFMFLDGADHVEPGRLARGRRGARIGPAVMPEGELQAFGARGGIEIRSPIPGGDGDIGLGHLRGDAHLLAAAPGDGAHISFGELVGAQHLARRLVELGHRIGNLEVEDLGRFMQALMVLVELEDGAVIGAHPLEHRTRIVQPVSEDVDLGIAPRDELAVKPDETLALIVRDDGHEHSSASKTGLLARAGQRSRRPS